MNNSKPIRPSLQFFAEGEPNTVDAVQEPVVEVQETAVDESVSAETTDTTDGVEAEKPQEVAKPVQDAETNAKMAEIRRKAEARVEQIAEQKAQELFQRKVDNEIRAQYQGQVNPYSGRPIDSKQALDEYTQQHQIAQMADKNGISFQEQQQLLKQTVQQSPEFKKAVKEAQELKQQVSQYRTIAEQQIFDKDLTEVLKHNPKETAKSIDDLGETFARARSMGASVLEAYNFSLIEKQRLNPKPQSMGDINVSGDAKDKNFTMAQIESMSQSEINKNYVAIMKSLKKINGIK